MLWGGDSQFACFFLVILCVSSPCMLRFCVPDTLSFALMSQAFKLKLKSARRGSYRPSSSRTGPTAPSGLPHPPCRSSAAGAAAPLANPVSSRVASGRASAPGVSAQTGNQQRSSALPNVRPRSGVHQNMAVDGSKRSPSIMSGRQSNRGMPYAAAASTGTHAANGHSTATDLARQAYAPVGTRHLVGSTVGSNGLVAAAAPASALDSLFAARRAQLQALKGSLGRAQG